MFLYNLASLSSAKGFLEMTSTILLYYIPDV
jgi:hypothetical protein